MATERKGSAYFGHGHADHGHLNYTHEVGSLDYNNDEEEQRRMTRELLCNADLCTIPRMTYKRIKMGKATSPDDVSRGRICSKSGYWFPGHDLVYVDGRPYGKRYAPAQKHPPRRPISDISELY